jgi:hypothetical protein
MQTLQISCFLIKKILVKPSFACNYLHTSNISSDTFNNTNVKFIGDSQLHSKKLLKNKYKYKYIVNDDKNKRNPVEVLIFSMKEEHVAEFLKIDHEVWTLGEATYGHGIAVAESNGSSINTSTSGSISGSEIPFLSKEVWLDHNNPGIITMHFIWKNKQKWKEISSKSLQEYLQYEFHQRFLHEYKVIRIDTCNDDDNDNDNASASTGDVYRYSRFERLDDDVEDVVEVD